MQGPRLGGHPIHPALVHFPVVCWTAAPLLDGLCLLRRDLACWQASFWVLIIGVVMALPTMTVGFMDLLAIPVGHPAQATGQRHMLLVACAWCVYTVDLLLRPLHVAPSGFQLWLALGLSLAGFVLLAAGAYAGAQLVYDFGIGQTGRSSSHRPS